MSYYRNHQHTQRPPNGFRSGSSPQAYAAVTATVQKSTERPITGRNGSHLQFYVNAGAGGAFQVDVNTQSRDGSQIGLYIAVEDLQPAPGDANQPFGAPEFGLIPDAQLSYAGLGLTNADFAPTDPTRIESQLENDLDQSTFLAVYGLSFDDAGTNGRDVRGIHETHFAGANHPNQDGALALYSTDPATSKPIRTWYFFKFQEDQIQ